MVQFQTRQMIAESDLREDIKAQPCEKCGEPIPEGVDSVLTFCRGRFIRLHEECADFLHHGLKGPRTAHGLVRT